MWIWPAVLTNGSTIFFRRPAAAGASPQKTIADAGPTGRKNRENFAGAVRERLCQAVASSETTTGIGVWSLS
jgi:hypothetical protein